MEYYFYLAKMYKSSLVCLTSRSPTLLLAGHLGVVGRTPWSGEQDTLEWWAGNLLLAGHCEVQLRGGRTPWSPTQRWKDTLESNSEVEGHLGVGLYCKQDTVYASNSINPQPSVRVIINSALLQADGHF